MRQTLLLASSSLMLFALAACSGGNEPAEAPADAASAPAASASAGPEATPSAEATPGAEPTDPAATPSASASPTPSASATTAARTPAPAASPARVAATAPAEFALCSACHSVQAGQNMVGPSLAGVVGRRSGSVAGFSYSPGLRGANVTWNDATLDRFLADPNSVAAGSTMPAPGLNPAQRRAVIAYLNSL